jgi:hypothetical protein
MFKMYPKTHGQDRGFSADEVRRGIPWVYTDVTCPHCQKVQPVAATSYVGGPCVACGQLTGAAGLLVCSRDGCEVTR